MDDDTNVAPAGGDVSVDDRLGSFDFDASEAPAGGQEEKQAEPTGDEKAIESVAAESETPEPKAAPEPDDDEREVNLRDNTRVKLSELKRAYRPNWEKEVQEFAQKHQEFQRQTQGFTQAQQQTAAMLQQAVEFVQARMPVAPDISLLETDPLEYNRQKALYDHDNETVQRFIRARDEHARQAKQQQALKRQQFLAREREATLRALPDLKDPVKAAKFSEAARNLGSELGYTPAEMNQIHDHRLMKLLAKAVRGVELEKDLERAKAKLKAAKETPATVQVQAPQRRRPSDARADAIRSRLEKLRKTGSPRDAEAVLSQFD